MSQRDSTLYTNSWLENRTQFWGGLPVLTKEFSALVMDLLRWDNVFTTALTNLFQYGFKSIRTVKSSFVIKTNICDGEVIKEHHAKMLWEERILWECALHQVNCDNMNQDYWGKSGVSLLGLKIECSCFNYFIINVLIWVGTLSFEARKLRDRVHGDFAATLTYTWKWFSVSLWVSWSRSVTQRFVFILVSSYVLCSFLFCISS